MVGDIQFIDHNVLRVLNGRETQKIIHLFGLFDWLSVDRLSRLQFAFRNKSDPGTIAGSNGLFLPR